MTISEQKKRLRKEILMLRGQLPEAYCLQADQVIASRLLALPEYRQAKVVFCYVSTAEEVSMQPVFEDAWLKGRRIGVPLCTEKGVMEVREIKSMTDLHSGYYGIMEPSRDLPLIRPDEIEFVVVPCLTCSHDGKRLGYGGGYYDRYLERVNAPKAVVCREELVRNDIPVEAHDIKIDMVITEKGTEHET